MFASMAKKCYNRGMKTRFQTAIDKIKNDAASLCDARQATMMLGGQMIGHATCPVCGGADALRVKDGEDGSIFTFCAAGCPTSKVRAALRAEMAKRGVSVSASPPWAED